MTCPGCGNDTPEEYQFCQTCLYNVHHPDAGDIHRRPLTPWEALKLTFYRSEKKWIDNIRSRRIEKDRDGKRVTVSDAGVMPASPRYLWPAPRRRSP